MVCPPNLVCALRAISVPTACKVTLDRLWCPVSGVGGEGRDFGEVVGEDAVAAPDAGAGEPVEAGAVEVVAVFEMADAAFAAGSLFDQTAEAGLPFVGLPGGTCAALAGNGHLFHAGVV
jgi:hypothetical protein